MKILWLFVLIQTAFAQSGFGRPYLSNTQLCHQWNCINRKLGLSDSLPTSDQFGIVLRGLLPSDWHGAVDNVLQTCYNDRPRRYSNTCPGQAILHCAVDQLIANCPDAFLRKNDACAPINTIAGFSNMFTQSRYENIGTNMQVEHRPEWFLRNYFNTKCCDLPPLFNFTTLSECGFASLIKYYIHNPTIVKPTQVVNYQVPQVAVSTTTPTNNGDSLQVVNLSDLQADNVPKPRVFDTSTTPANNGNSLQVVSLSDLPAENVLTEIDPLECCDISDFVHQTWRQECKFDLSWEDQNRLVIKHESPTLSTEAPVSTSTTGSVLRTDLTIVPQSCEKETCVFNKLNILTSTGSVDIESFIKLLDNFTSSQPSWASAKARVVTSCLRKPVTEYTADCEINKVLGCTFDVLTENCPNATRNDLCKRSVSERTCQISSSKYRPKHRRDICPLPDLVDREVLKECGIISLAQMQPVTTVIRPKTYRLFSSTNKCHDLTSSTSCLLSKMDVLNKYGFLDYFKMMERIRNFTSNSVWASRGSVLMDALNGPLYTEHCNSPKKLLNVIESMLLTCPESKKKNTAQCASLFNQIKNTPPNNRNISDAFSHQMLNHFLHVFNPSAYPKVVRPKHVIKIKKTPVYNYGILDNSNAPKVSVIDVKPKKLPLVEKTPLVEKPPLVLLPVYMRVPHTNLLIRPFKEDGVMRSSLSFYNEPPYSTASSISTPAFRRQPVSGTTRRISTTPYVSTTQPVITKRPFSTTYPNSIRYDDKFEMLKPE